MEVKRKGARSAKDIPPAILEQLNKGEIETVNLTEWLSVDQELLLQSVLKELKRSHYSEEISEAVGSLKKKTVNTINKAIGESLYTITVRENDLDLFRLLSHHLSDMVRCWSVYMYVSKPYENISSILEGIKMFAADTHFGVREIAWLAVRKPIIDHLTESIGFLATWTVHTDENIRRFATEATRPRGVWCEHIEALKQYPEAAMVLLEAMKSDPSKYVQNSVGNWLNDASKTRPDFVKMLCEKWRKESPSKETAYIIKRALRTLNLNL